MASTRAAVVARTRLAVIAVAAIAFSAACTHPVGGKATSSASTTGTATSSTSASSPTSASSSPSSVSPSSSTPPRSSVSSPKPSPSTSAPVGRLFGREWSRLPTARHVVALTFDAGGDAAGVSAIVAALTQAKVSASFFLTGNWAQRYPAQCRTLAAAGLIGDHSMTHPHFTGLTNAQIASQVNSSASVIASTCGANPKPFFRFPYGDRDQRVIDAVNGLGYVPIGWTVDTLGWKGTSGGVSVASIVSRVLAQAQPGEIVLMHVGANPDDGTTLDASALPQVIAGLKQRGYTFVTLSALLTMTS